MRLVHAADLHLDSPLRGLSRLGDDAMATILRSATRRALENLVELVLQVDATILVLAGDVYDGDWHDYSTGRFFVQQLDRLHDEGVRVFLVAGNHDAASEITRALRPPPSVTMMQTNQPEVVVVDDLGVAVHGQGFATRAVRQNLAVDFTRRVPGLVNVGLLHANVDGAEGHDPYAPCRLEDLTGLGYDYFALGHVHQRAVLHEGEQTVAYSGNLQGRHIRESGPKGALVVDVEPGAGATVEFRALDVARWARVPVPVDDCQTLDDALHAADRHLRRAVEDAGGRPVAARVEFTGYTAVAADLADAPQIREEIDRIATRAGAVLERVRVTAIPPATRDTIDDLVEAIMSAATDLAADPTLVRQALRSLDREVGPELRETGLLDLADVKTLTRLAVRAGTSLQSRLGSGVR
jgi:DNA repair protein SbcD/Mre11